jgi:phosphoserine aminotransferase
MITFAPGPSKVYDRIPSYFHDAYEQGILSANHRSEVFMNLYKDTEETLKIKLQIPANYKLLFTSSATENWEIITQSLVRHSSFHIYSGSFGKKWFGFAKHILENTDNLLLSPEKEIEVGGLSIGKDHDLIAITQNETSNATQVKMEVIGALGEQYPDKMLAIDTTSSMAGIYLDFSLADIWYASVQKCFGLPAGLGLLILSPKAVEKAEAIGEKGRYNSLNFMLENAANHQTHYTPNVLGIYLLNRVLHEMADIREVHERTEKRMKALEQIVAQSGSLGFLVKNEATRSRTVLGVAGKEAFIQQIKKDALAEGMQLGSGYGNLKPTSFRIANFPALTDAEFNQMAQFLAKY